MALCHCRPCRQSVTGSQNNNEEQASPQKKQIMHHNLQAFAYTAQTTLTWIFSPRSRLTDLRHWKQEMLVTSPGLLRWWEANSSQMPGCLEAGEIRLFMCDSSVNCHKVLSHFAFSRRDLYKLWKGHMAWVWIWDFSGVAKTTYLALELINFFNVSLIMPWFSYCLTNCIFAM